MKKAFALFLCLLLPALGACGSTTPQPAGPATDPAALSPETDAAQTPSPGTDAAQTPSPGTDVSATDPEGTVLIRTTAAGTEAPEEADPYAPLYYFSFDRTDETGRFLEDRSGRAATSRGKPVQSEGKNGKALSVNASSSLEFEGSALPQGDRPHSIAVWVRAKSGTAAERVVAGWGTYSKLLDTRLLIYKGALCVSSYSVYTTAPVPDDLGETWHHLAITYASRRYRLYLDGVAVADVGTSGISVTGTTLCIGGFGKNGKYFDGELDDLYIFDRALTPEEIRGCMENASDFSQIRKDSQTVNELKTTTYSGRVTGRTYCSGIGYDYTVSVPLGTSGEETALILTFDGLNEPLCRVMGRLFQEGAAPAAVVLGVGSGTTPATLSGGNALPGRQYSYDVFGPEFPLFLTEELIPYVLRTHSIQISSSPDLHMAAGSSSGGICAWKCAWFCNDYFHRVYLSSPTFASMNKGYTAPILARLTEPKAIRGFMDYSETEPNAYFGDLVCAALEAKSAFTYAGYDFEYRCNPGSGHSSHWKSETGLEEAMRSVWRDWKTKAVRPIALQPYLAKIISLSDGWEKVSGPMPEGLRPHGRGGVYSVSGGEILYTPSSGGASRTVASGFGAITALAVSSDGWRLYIADRGCVYACSILADGSLQDRQMLTSLHTLTDWTVPGALSLCVDREDRVYAATELGIQVIRSFGQVEGIVPLPDGAVPEEIAFGGEENGWLYARNGDTVWRRRWKVPGKASETALTEPKTRTYYN
ncbi:MAG: SMP-30/gluconolactonase/LRE family protein [Clostridia bacterium]|nr:SMP-30/gluconolactonase/LRE family protein [Clostridia bacterium]